MTDEPDTYAVPHGEHGPDCIHLVLNSSGLAENAVVGEPSSLPEGWEAVCLTDAPEGAWIGCVRQPDGTWEIPHADEEA